MADVPVAVAVGVASGVLGAMATGLTIATRVMRAFDSRMKEQIMLALSNGAGDRVEELITLGVLKALEHHRDNCPARDDLNALKERVDRLSNEWRVR